MQIISNPTDTQKKKNALVRIVLKCSIIAQQASYNGFFYTNYWYNKITNEKITGRVARTRQNKNSDDPRERDHLEDLEADGRILKWI